MTRAPTAGGTQVALDMSRVLAGDFGAAGVREVAQNPFQYGIRELLEATAPGVGVVAQTLLRTKYKPGRKLTATYELVIPGVGRRHACVTWTTEPRSLLLSPADPDMPQLRVLTDPGQLTDMLARLTGRSVAAGPPRPDIQTLRYRPGQRHVLSVRPSPDSARLIVKTDRDDSGRLAVPVARAVARLLTARGTGLFVAEPVGYLAAERTAAWRCSPGQPLSHTISSNAADSARLVHLLGRGLRTWHDTGPQVAPALRRQVVDRSARSVRGELDSSRRAGQLIAVLRPEVWSTYDAVLTEVTDRLHALPSDDSTLVHGDLKGDNVLVSGGELHVLDLDRAAWTDPALDLGKFLADLHWWCADDAHAGQLGAAFRDGYGATDPERWLRAELIATMYRLAFAGRRCAVHDRGWDARVARQVDLAAASLRAGVWT